MNKNILPWFLFAAAILFALPSLAAENPSLPTVDEDGVVTADGKLFSSLSAYHESPEFAASGRRCGTKTPEAMDQLDSAMAAESDCTVNLTNIKDEYYPKVALVIPVWFHVIYKADGTGNISDEAITAQMAVLNEDYRAITGSYGENSFDTMVQFSLVGITRTQNDDWFNDRNEAEYKAALGKDQTRYLNVYTNAASGYLGYSYFPQEDAGTTLDGVVMLYETVGGRDNGYGEYDQGRSLVHEIGHYLGLYHTFRDGGSCPNSYSSGDLIMDTNAESTDHYSCTQTTTCNSDDPIHNFMNYTPDTCMYEFTQEQANRLVCGLVNYRSELYHPMGLDLSGTYQLLLDD